LVASGGFLFSPRRIAAQPGERAHFHCSIISRCRRRKKAPDRSVAKNSLRQATFSFPFPPVYPIFPVQVSLSLDQKLMKKGKKKSTYTRKKIVDEFTDLPISRQQKWQLRRAKEGRCVICGEPKVTAWHCLKHAIANREWARKYSGSVRRNKTLTYRLAAETKGKKKR
jgi:hypothetical protein